MANSKRNRFPVTLFRTFVLAAVVFWTGVAGAEYQAIDLQTLGGWGSIATSINGSTQVIGDSFTTEGDTHAFLWNNSTQLMQDLETLGGTWSSSFAINAAGKVVGDSENGQGAWHAFLWDSVSGMRDLQSLGGGWSHADAINSLGQVAGDSNDTNGDIHAFFWDGAQMHDLETLGGDWSYTGALNAAGQVVGDSLNGNSEDHAFLWQSPGPMWDLGTLPGGTWSYAIAINASGQVAGSSDNSNGEDHAFLWTSPGPMKDLGTLGGTWSYASATNAAGQVVGVSQTDTGEDHAFLWTSPGPMKDLGTLGGTWSYAFSLNDCGQVVGGSQTVSGEEHAFVWDNINGMQDLGTLPGGDSSTAYDINIWGEIVGRSLIGSGDDHAVLFRRVETPISDLITHFYNVVLGRPPEACAVSSWENGYFVYALNFNIDVRFIPTEMGRLFFSAEEYRNRNRSNAQFITDCYRAFLYRSPNTFELNEWLNGVWTRPQAVSIFANSDEFKNYIKGLFPGLTGVPSRNFVTAMYIGLLDRLVDSAGLAYWASLFDNAVDKRQMSKYMGEQVTNGDEFRSKHPNNGTIIVSLYRAFLGRYPAESESAYWTNELNAGRQTVNSLVNVFANSQEFSRILSIYFP